LVCAAYASLQRRGPSADRAVPEAALSQHGHEVVSAFVAITQPQESAMTVQEIAADFAALCKAGNFAEAGEKYWSADIVSVEPGAPPGGDPASHGIDAVRAKGVWWYDNHEVHGIDVQGPYINGDQFIMRFKMDVTMKASGTRMQMEEDALYTVEDGKIVEERFFFGG
jgi:ketosteroid isomerase-like protein